MMLPIELRKDASYTECSPNSESERKKTRYEQPVQMMYMNNEEEMSKYVYNG